MSKGNYSQLELFEGSNVIGPEKLKACSSFLFQVKNHEKAILMLITFIITAVVSFSLGIEKGKQSVKSESHILNPVVKEQPREPTLKKESDFKPARLKESLENYTIQVASYQIKTNAQKEAEALKRRGFSTLVVSKGKHSIVCVGNFTNKEKAQPSLSELKKRYRDCLIIKL